MKRSTGKTFHTRNGLLYAADTDHGDAWIFSQDGLLRSAVQGREKIKRGWDGRVKKISLEAGGTAPSTIVSGSAAQTLTEKAHRRAEIVFEAVSNGSKSSCVPMFDPDKYQTRQNKFEQIYGRVPILPPDQYRSLLVNLSVGCSYNQCDFCDFYRGRTHQIRTDQALQRHLDDVVSYFDGLTEYFNGIFFGEADGLEASAADIAWAYHRLCIDLDFDNPPFYLFGRPASIEGKSSSELKNLAELGLRRVYLGLETGSDRLRADSNKPFTSDQFLDACQRLEQAGIARGIIVILGLGGKQREEEHRMATNYLLQQLEFTGEDRLFLSPLYHPSGEPERDPVDLPTSECLQNQLKLFMDRWNSVLPVARYDINNFLY